MIYRIAEVADWQQAQQTDFFASADLAAEGFIHTSAPNQILETARRYYAGRADLILLEVDEDALAQAGVQVTREWVASRQQHFAHEKVGGRVGHRGGRGHGFHAGRG